MNGLPKAKIDLSALASAMLEWEAKKKELDEIEAEIREAVLLIGKTQTVGNVRASYSAGRKTYDYEEGARGHPMVSEATIRLFTTPKVDWKGICGHAGIDDVPYKESGPSVTLKILEVSKVK